MAAAAALLAGKHDFRLFCERPAEQPSTLVVVEKAEVATAGALILVRLSASHFLWKMVRRVVGTLVQIGAGELDRRDFETLLAAEDAEVGQGAAGRMDGSPFRTVPGARPLRGRPDRWGRSCRRYRSPRSESGA